MHVQASYGAYFSVLLLDVGEHRFSRVYASDQDRFGQRIVSGPDDDFAGEPMFAAGSGRLVLRVDGAESLWDEAQRSFVPIGPERALPE